MRTSGTWQDLACAGQIRVRGGALACLPVAGLGPHPVPLNPLQCLFLVHWLSFPISLSRWLCESLGTSGTMQGLNHRASLNGWWVSAEVPDSEPLLSCSEAEWTLLLPDPPRPGPGRGVGESPLAPSCPMVRIMIRPRCTFGLGPRLSLPLWKGSGGSGWSQNHSNPHPDASHPACVEGAASAGHRAWDQ